MATTYDLTFDSTAYPMPGRGNATPTIRNPMHGVFTLTSRILEAKDFADTNNTFQMLDLPLGCSILGGYLTILEAPNEACDVVIGTTGVDPNGLLESTTLNTTDAVNKTVAFAGTLIGGVNLTADTADITFSNVAARLTAGRFLITVILAGNPTTSVTGP